jgi:hypothetical protein
MRKSFVDTYIHTHTSRSSLVHSSFSFRISLPFLFLSFHCNTLSSPCYYISKTYMFYRQFIQAIFTAFFFLFLHTWYHVYLDIINSTTIMHTHLPVCIHSYTLICLVEYFRLKLIVNIVSYSWHSIIFVNVSNKEKAIFIRKKRMI